MSELVSCTELQALSNRGALGRAAAHLVGGGSAMSIQHLAGHSWQAEQWQWDAQGFKAEPAGKSKSSSTSGSGKAFKEADTHTGSGQQSGSVDTGRAKVCVSNQLLPKCMQHSSRAGYVYSPCTIATSDVVSSLQAAISSGAE